MFVNKHGVFYQLARVTDMIYLTVTDFNTTFVDYTSIFMMLLVKYAASYRVN